jgi:restriction endonuclease Mrr
MFPYAWPAFLRTIASILSDGKTHTYVGLLTRAAQAHALTPDERKLTMANGQNVFVSRVDFALARLVTEKGIIKLVPKDGPVAYHITEHGLDVVRRKGKEVKIQDF